MRGEGFYGFEVLGEVVYVGHALDFIVGDGDVEFFFEADDGVDYVEGIGTEVFVQIGLRGDE